MINRLLWLIFTTGKWLAIGFIGLIVVGLGLSIVLAMLSGVGFISGDMSLMILLQSITISPDCLPFYSQAYGPDVVLWILYCSPWYTPWLLAAVGLTVIWTVFSSYRREGLSIRDGFNDRATRKQITENLVIIMLAAFIAIMLTAFEIPYIAVVLVAGVGAWLFSRPVVQYAAKHGLV